MVGCRVPDGACRISTRVETIKAVPTTRSPEGQVVCSRVANGKPKASWRPVCDVTGGEARPSGKEVVLLWLFVLHVFNLSYLLPSLC